MKGRSRPAELLPPPYALSFSPSRRPSCPVVPGCLGHRALHRRLQTHGKLSLLCNPRHDGHRFYLDNGLFLCCSTPLWLVQVSRRMLSSSPSCSATTPAGQEMHSWLRRETRWAPGERGNGASQNRIKLPAVSLTVAWNPLTKGSASPAAAALHAPLVFCGERGASTGTARLTHAVKSPPLSADHKEGLDDLASRQGCSGEANLAVLASCHPSIAPRSPAAPFPAPLPRCPREPVCAAPSTAAQFSPPQQMPPSNNRVNAGW